MRSHSSRALFIHPVPFSVEILLQGKLVPPPILEVMPWHMNNTRTVISIPFSGYIISFIVPQGIGSSHCQLFQKCAERWRSMRRSSWPPAGSAGFAIYWISFAFILSISDFSYFADLKYPRNHTIIMATTQTIPVIAYSAVFSKKLIVINSAVMTKGIIAPKILFFVRPNKIVLPI